MNTAHLEDTRDEIEAFDDTRATNADRLRLAKVLLDAAIALAEEVAYKTDDGEARAYWVAKAKIMAGDGHGYLSRDFNLDQWIARVETDTEE